MDINIPIQGTVLIQKVEEIALKLNSQFMPLNGWKYRSRRLGGHSYRTMSGEYKNVTEEEKVNTTLVLQPMDQGIIRSLKQKNFTGTLFVSSCRESHYQRMLQSTFVSCHIHACSNIECCHLENNCKLLLEGQIL
jgi:hypothetical protein